MRAVCVLALMMVGAACSPVGDQALSDDPIGDFRMGHAVVVAPNPIKGPVSREATPDEWIAAVDRAVESRLRRLQGDRYYHLGIAVMGYALAPPGIPIVAAPKSLLIIQVNMWDQSTQTRLTTEPHQIVVGEGVSGETIISSGLTRSKARQMEVLSDRAAAAIETWLRKVAVEEGWFNRPPPPPEEAAGAAPAAVTKASTPETSTPETRAPETSVPDSD
ncbi:MAG: hypothetical protein ACPG7W_07660, partial [Paracoccaceae bacterium]